jgi:hypothetical protein
MKMYSFNEWCKINEGFAIYEEYSKPTLFELMRNSEWVTNADFIWSSKIDVVDSLINRGATPWLKLSGRDVAEFKNNFYDTSTPVEELIEAYWPVVGIEYDNELTKTAYPAIAHGYALKDKESDSVFVIWIKRDDSGFSYGVNSDFRGEVGTGAGYVDAESVLDMIERELEVDDIIQSHETEFEKETREIEDKPKPKFPPRPDFESLLQKWQIFQKDKTRFQKLASEFAKGFQSGVETMSDVAEVFYYLDALVK